MSYLSERTRVSESIKRITADNRSGAAEILRSSVEIFSLLSAEKITDIEEARSLVIETCSTLAQAQPGMAPLVRLASEAVSAALANPDDAITAAAEAAEKFINDARQAIARAASRAACLIKEETVILTHSRSSTALDAFIKAKRDGKRFAVIATESRPVFEGRALAAELAREGLGVSIIADAAAALVMDRVDFVLMGADKVTPRHVVNKIGTRMIALAAYERSLPVYALSDTSKFINAAEISSIADDLHSGEELWPDAPDSIAVLNSYLEPTPLNCFTHIITEDGMLSPEKASRRAEAMTIHPALMVALG